MEIVLIRHGQTAGNLAGKYIGKTDEPLCPEGIAAVRLAGIFPGVAGVYVSSKRRTRETADLLFPKAKQIICHDLREMDFGDFEGRSAIEMKTDHEYRAWVDSGCQGACPNGESTSEFRARVREAFDEIVKEKIYLNSSCRRADIVEGSADQRNEDRMIILAHGGTIMAVMAAFARPARDYFDWHTGNVKGWRTYLDKKTIFETACKEGIAPRGIQFLSEICAKVSIPVYSIGGINESRIATVMQAGASGICVMSQLMTCCHPDEKVKEYQRLTDTSHLASNSSDKKVDYRKIII